MQVLLAAVKISGVICQFVGSYAIVSSHLFTTAWPSKKTVRFDLTILVVSVFVCK